MKIDSTAPHEQLRFGDGPLCLELFLEPTCPYSKRAFDKFPRLLDLIGHSALTLRLRLLSQSWHLFSPVVTRCVLAAVATAGDAAGMTVLQAIYNNRERFVCDRHCTGPNLALSPKAVSELIVELSGVDLLGAFDSDSVTSALIWQTKYARQNGIHVTPTFVVNGIVTPALSSGQSVEQWAAIIRPE